MIELMRQRLAIDWAILTEYWWVWLVLVTVCLIVTIVAARKQGR